MNGMEGEFDAVDYCLLRPTCHTLFNFFLILPYLLSRRDVLSSSPCYGCCYLSDSPTLVRSMAAAHRTPPRLHAPWLLLVGLAHAPELRELGPCRTGAGAAPELRELGPCRAAPHRSSASWGRAVLHRSSASWGRAAPRRSPEVALWAPDRSSPAPEEAALPFAIIWRCSRRPTPLQEDVPVRTFFWDGLGPDFTEYSMDML